jgi:hypothetical protein
VSLRYNDKELSKNNINYHSSPLEREEINCQKLNWDAKWSKYNESITELKYIYNLDF